MKKTYLKNLKKFFLSKIELIVGLSNPGKKYALTRHSVGAWYVQMLSKVFNKKLKIDKKLHGYTAEIFFKNKKIKLLVPNTYMNLSGNSILKASYIYKIDPNKILIAHDEIYLSFGRTYFQIGGSSNGHNGIKNIKKKLGEKKNFYRLKIGIGNKLLNNTNIADFVLSRPSLVERKKILNAIRQEINFLFF
ncbi:hypothetical protein AOQ88_01775 [Candidatus Riesia sp. GBBU]|nr:hypothetical protein AOQ88_01775 [Candidatus Riesia sp. GBBU]